jgi:hypothetical protein
MAGRGPMKRHVTWDSISERDWNPRIPAFIRGMYADVLARDTAEAGS